jgi:hypothetical protein
MTVDERLRWSWGSVLAFGTKVRGFKPGRNRQIFQGEKKNPQHAFLRRVNKSSPVPCRRFAASKRTLKVALTRYFQAKFTGHFSPNSSTLHCLGPWSHCDVQDTWCCKLERLRFRVVQKACRLRYNGGISYRNKYIKNDGRWGLSIF